MMRADRFTFDPPEDPRRILLTEYSDGMFSLLVRDGATVGDVRIDADTVAALGVAALGLDVGLIADAMEYVRAMADGRPDEIGLACTADELTAAAGTFAALYDRLDK